MIKHITLLFAFVGLTAIVNAQKFKTFSDNFESYSNNDWLSQNSTVWETWSGNPSTNNDDVRVTTSDAYSGSKSIYFSSGPGPEDVVLPFGGLYDTGQFVYKSMMKIPSGKSAYFNFQGATSVGTTWSVEVSFETNGSLDFSNQGSGTMFSTKYPQGQWFEIKIYVNLTKNEWHVFIDQDYKGVFSNSINKVSHLDLYPADNNASFWVDDVSFTYAPPTPNNAGIEVLIAPQNAVCGKNALKVRLVNNGTNQIDSVRVYWMLDSVLQSPVFVKTKIDTNNSTSGNRLVAILDTLNLGKGAHTIKAWTAFPNGVADTLNFDDTLRASIRAGVRGVKIDYAYPFQGNKGSGLAVWPDTVCAGDTLTYGITPPTGYTNADLGTGWTIKSIDIKSNGIPPVDTQTIMPRGKADFRLRYVADTSEGNFVFKIDVSVSVGKGGCDTVLTHYFVVEPQPDVAFSTNDVCLGKPMFFTNNSKGRGSGTIKYLWKFGDKTSSTLVNTSRIYTRPGTYDVTLRATAATGCRATTTQSVRVYHIPEPKFGVADACYGSSVSFNDSSTIDSGSIAGYFWDFGDGDTSNLKNANHVYGSPGTYKVRLFVTSDVGCTDKTNAEVEVHPVPDASISGNDICEQDSVMFGNATGYSGKDSLHYNWDFGDGKRSTDGMPTHTYAQSGDYAVEMIVTSSNGCVDTATTTVEVFPLPTADFSTSNACLGKSIAFANNSSVSSGSITHHHWSLGDGTTATMKDTAYTYQKSRTYTAELHVTSTGGCTDSIAKEVEVYPLPQAGFALNNVCQDIEVTFDNQSTTKSDTLEYQWNFGDGNTSNAQSPENTYTQDGNYLVKLLVNTENGCKDSIEKPIEIYPLPEAGFTFKHKGWGQYDFAPDDANLVTYKWYFGDGDSSTDVTPYHEYAAEGDYDARLRTTDSNGCVAEQTINVSVSTGIAEEGRVLNPLKVFPNPFKDEVNIVYELQNAGNVSIEVYSLNGVRLVNLVNQEQSNGKYQYKFNTPEASGVYMVRMVINGQVYHERIVKTQ